MATVEDSQCPRCGAEPGTLTLSKTLDAKPIGSFSLAGVQMKVSATERPVLSCSACGLRVVGRFQGRHVVFPQQV